MCTMIAHQVQIMGRAKSGLEWFEVREANVSYDHPYDLPLEHALNLDFVNEALGPGARVAVELSVDAARQLVKAIEAVLAQADQRGVLEDVPVIAVPTSVGYGASFDGMAALLGMMNACAPGVAVVNIDNGFGAGYLASQMSR